MPDRDSGVFAEEALNCSIDNWSVGRSLAAAHGCFFLAFASGTRAEIPRVHFDGPPSFRTGIVYLTPGAPDDAGTSFWRHRPTGLFAARVEADALRLGRTVEELEQWLERDATKRAHWEEIDRIGNRYNRAVFFAPHLLHSATRHFGRRVENGRLYQSFHFEVRRASQRVRSRV